MPISTINSNSLSTSAQIPSLTTASGSAPSYSARAWVNFNGTNTVAIRASGNVSSITDNGVGIYTMNFTTAMPDVNYSAVGCHNAPSAGSASVVFGYDSPASYSTTALTLTTFNATNPYRADASQITAAIFR